MLRSRHSRSAALALGLICVAFLFSITMRAEQAHQDTGAQGLQATYHVLWTDRALEKASPSSHFYLPTVTERPSHLRGIRWGQTVETPGGSFVYTSFPPLGFLVPELILGLRSQQISFSALVYFNFAIGLIAALAMAGLARAAVLSVLDESEDSAVTGWAVFGLTGVLYLFLREALTSHGEVYWPHSLAQLPLILGSWCAFRIFQGRLTVLSLLGLGLACLIYPSLEWTGFFFGAGVFVALAYLLRASFKGEAAVPVSRSGLLLTMAVVAVATAAAGLAILMHYILVIGLGPLMQAFASRAYARTFRFSAAVWLPLGYFISFGALVPLALLALHRAISHRLFFDHRAIWLLLFVTTFPMLENLAMMQHASQFSFDRLKLAVPLLLISMLVLAVEGLARNLLVVTGLACLVIATNVQIWSWELLYYKPWGDAVKSNQALVERFEQDPLAQCALYGSPDDVRGYLNDLFDRDIYEKTDRETLLSMADPQHDCGVVVVKTENVFADLPRLQWIAVYDAEKQLLRTYSDPASLPILASSAPAGPSPQP